MKKPYLALLCVMAMLAFTSIALASGTTGTKPIGPQVEHTWVKHPHPERVFKHFTPTSTPSPDYVKNVIIPYEAARYNTSPITDRVECESSFDYGASNGTYGGLIQTDGAFWYGSSDAWPAVVNDHDLGVVMKRKKRVARNVYKVRLWSNGKKQFKRVAIQHVPRTIIQKGKLPETADWFHGWAAIRVGERAVAGVGPTTWWACTHEGSHY